MSNEHFNLISQYYDRAAKFELDDFFLLTLDLPCEGYFLDAGGGTGRVAASLSNLVKGRIVADVSSGMLVQARKKGLNCILAPVESLPLQDDAFERIFMLDAFHHLSDQRKAAQELYRLLRPGGRLVIVEPNIHNFMVKLIALGEKILGMRSHFFSGEQILDIFLQFTSKVELKYHLHNVWVIVVK